jgi:hypothetical protein
MAVYHLILNADDFGYCPQRNKGIIEAFRNDGISSATLLVNGLFAKDAVQLALENKLPLGLHFNITEGKPICNPLEILSLVNESGLFLGKFGLRDALDQSLVDVDHVSWIEVLFFVEKNLVLYRLGLNWRLKLKNLLIFMVVYLLMLMGISIFMFIKVKPLFYLGSILKFETTTFFFKTEICDTFSKTLKSFKIDFTRLPYEELNNEISSDRKTFYESVLSDCNESIEVFSNLK